MVVAFGFNSEPDVIPDLMGIPTHVAHLLSSLVQVSFSTLPASAPSVVQRGAIAAGPTDRLWEVFYQLMAYHRAGMLGAGIGRVDVHERRPREERGRGAH